MLILFTPLTSSHPLTKMATPPLWLALFPYVTGKLSPTLPTPPALQLLPYVAF